MHIDLRCLGVGLFALIVVGVAAAIPMDTYRTDQDDGSYAAKRVHSNMWYRSLIAPRDARTRETFRKKSSDSQVSHVNNSITKFDSIELCQIDQVCKLVDKNSFKCRCPVLTKCVADGRHYDAICNYSTIGVVYHQPGY